MPQILGIIPARYGSTRFEGKPLVDIAGKSLIRRVYEQALKAQKLHKVVVATDDKRIYDHVEQFGGEVVMTQPTHQSGTDRCAEVAQQWGQDYEICLNIQGDEPFVNPEQIDILASLFDQDDTQIATLMMPITKQTDIFSDKEVKIVFTPQMEALYMSRSPIPYIKDMPPEQWLQRHTFYKHLGIYGYRREVLLQIAQLPPSPLEQVESLEQLRWMAHFRIKLGISNQDTLSIDTPEDLAQVPLYLASTPNP